MSGSITERLIDVSFSLGTGPTGQGAGETYTYSGLRVTANIVEAGGFISPTGQFTIYGMPPAEMNKISSLGLYALRARNNVITVSAGDAVNGMSQVFSGQILEAYIDFANAPDAAFQVSSLDALNVQLSPATATGFNGGVPVATIMQTLATQMGYSFQNNGVTSLLSNPYFPGSLADQVKACAVAANINYQMRQGVLAIWPKYSPRGGAIPTISPETGMIGYPSFASNGLALRTLFNPEIMIGGQVNVQSSLTAACGNWMIFQLAHTLESQTPNGMWESQIYAMHSLEGVS